jgi:hypothetical protein
LFANNGAALDAFVLVRRTACVTAEVTECAQVRRGRCCTGTPFVNGESWLEGIDTSVLNGIIVVTECMRP